MASSEEFVKYVAEQLTDPETAPPYEGAKPYFLITELDDKELLCKLSIATCKALPEH